MGLFEKTRRASALAKKFRDDRSGGIALMAGFAFPVMVIAAGGALDYTHAVTTTQKAQRVMDSTVLALTRRDLSTIDVQAEGTKLFEAMLDKRGMRTTNSDMQFGLNGQVVSGSAQVQTKSYFLNVIGLNAISGKVASSAVPPLNRPIEISLVLDVSGSMSTDLNGQPRISRLQDAVNAMFDKLDETLPSNAKLSAAVVPYSTSVNVGDFPQALENTSVGGEAKPVGLVDLWAAERMVAANGTGYNITDAGPNPRRVPFVTAAEVGNTSPTARMAPLTNDIDAVRASVNAMTPNGWTAGHIGMAWGTYALSDKWSGIWPTAPSPTGSADKIIVMLSDGMFNTTHNIGDTSLTPDPTTGRAPKNDNQDESDAYFQDVCDLARNEGMTIYAVALALDPTSEAKLQACVGSSGKLYTADSATGLSKAFEDIAIRLGTHRLTS